ncbi:MAG TPA: ATP-binding protein [Steroidobacteraceae bacterium]|nr:ATP-binding protein [Steroidobacteraceae bacterium]
MRQPTPSESRQLEEARQENEALRIELEEARETLNAIRSGAVDALVIETPQGQRTYTLDGAEQIYRSLIEHMQEGAVILDRTGSVQYCNQRFAELLGLPLEKVIGRSFANWLGPADRTALRAWGSEGSIRLEMRLCAQDGTTVPALISGVADAGSDAMHLIVTDLSERKRYELGIVQLNSQLEQRIAARTAELEDANRRKDEFLAVLSHELRNPLAPIRTAAQILASPGLGAHQLRWVQEVVSRQVQHLAWLLDDLLDMARITQGKLELKKERVALIEVIDAAVEEARTQIEAKHHSLVVSLPPQSPELDADKLRLSQVVSNLLTNAAKYTDPGGHIELSARVQDQMLRLAVKDNGIGLAPDALQSIFTMFSQVKDSLNRTEGGLGIGLALIKGLVALHGGKVEAHSAGLGRGSEFVVHLPISSARAAGVAETPESDPGNPPTAVRRILIADDNGDAAESLAMLLRLNGHDVRVAHDGREAITLAHVFRPHVALLDLGMPQMNGYEAARAIRREHWGADMILVALTGWGQDRDKQQALGAGFDHHFTKPVDASWLAAWIAASPRRQ